MQDIEKSAVSKVTRRFIPFLVVCYLVSYLDKVNVGFAALSMNHDLGMTPAQFGFGAGVFFIAYSLFEIPSNLALVRFGARRWLARIMITWGIVSAATAFVTGPSGFYLLRTVLGAAEAGFFPGIIFFLTLWFPARYRARMIGYFMVAIPLSSFVGSPVSVLLLRLDGMLGLAGWQWLFMLEAIPAILLGLMMLSWITDRPEDASWLTGPERNWLVGQLARDKSARLANAQPVGLLRAVFSPVVLALTVIYFGATGLHQAMSFWLPQIVKGFGLTTTETGFVAAVPYLCGAIGMVVWGRRSDLHAERKGHAAFALAIATLGIAASAMVDVPVLKLAALSIAAIGVFGVLPVFWTLPTVFLGERAAAGGIAFVNCVGSLAGLAAPWAIGVIRQETGSFQNGLLAVAGVAAISLVILLLLPLSQARHDAVPAAGK
jgi:ACS family tartrate transporter-like MFS transporter